MNQSRGKRVLVTGGLGYIGCHTVVELINEGFSVSIVDDLSNTSLDVIDAIVDITGVRPDFQLLDLKEEPALEAYLNGSSFDAVIHFAASKSVGESAVDPLKYYENNVNGIVNLIRHMNRNKIENFVFSSSCTVYGQPDKLPVDENTPIKPAESPYGNSKKIGEDILRDSCIAYESFNAIALRYFNPIGAHASGKIGEKSNEIPNNLMPYIMQVADGQRECLSVFGNNYNTKDGTAIRDYLHVVDLAKAHVLALVRQLRGNQIKSFECFNLGSGTGYSVMDIIESFERVNEVKVNYKFVDRRAGDIEQIFADNAFAEKELNWKTQLGLDDMVKSAWKWQKSATKNQE